MEKTYSMATLQLPRGIVESSPAVAIDIGCSNMKIAFRSKEDYENGKPRNKMVKEDSGQLCIVSDITSENTEDVCKFVSEKCDINYPRGEKPTITCCRLRSKEMESKLSQALSVKIQPDSQFDCAVKALQFLAHHSADQLFLEPHPEALEAAKEQAKLYETLAVMNDKGFKMDRSQRADTVDFCDDEKLPIFPCILALCGSTVTFIKVESNGQWELVGQTPLGGRMFLGLAGLMTGQKDFDSIYSAVCRGSHQGIDEFFSDLMTAEGDDYNCMANYNRPIMMFGKAVTKERDDLPDDDILHSLYHNWCENILLQGGLNCSLHNTWNLYLAGKFVTTERCRYFLTKENTTRMAMRKKGMRVHLEFIRNGANLASIGAFLKGASSERPSEAETSL